MTDFHVTGRRVVATIIDAIIFSIAYSIFAAIFGTTPKSQSGLDFARLSTGAGLGWLLLVVLYYLLMEGYHGRTVGKMVTGIRVVSEATGRPPGLGGAAIRTVLRIVDGLISYLVGFIIVLSSSKRRRLGDMAAKTLVVRA